MRIVVSKEWTAEERVIVAGEIAAGRNLDGDKPLYQRLEAIEMVLIQPARFLVDNTDRIAKYGSVDLACE
jgi:hypothetical protein